MRYEPNRGLLTVIGVFNYRFTCIPIQIHGWDVVQLGHWESVQAGYPPVRHINNRDATRRLSLCEDRVNLPKLLDLPPDVRAHGFIWGQFFEHWEHCIRVRDIFVICDGEPCLVVLAVWWLWVWRACDDHDFIFDRLGWSLEVVWD